MSALSGRGFESLQLHYGSREALLAMASVASPFESLQLHYGSREALLAMASVASPFESPQLHYGSRGFARDGGFTSPSCEALPAMANLSRL